VEAARNGGRMIRLPTGHYRITAPIDLPSGIQLSGSGQGRTVLEFTDLEVGIRVHGKVRVTIQDLTIQNIGKSKRGAGIWVEGPGSGNHMIRDVEVLFFADGVRLTASSPVGLERVRTSGNAHSGIYLSDSDSGVPSTDITLRDILSVANDGDGVAVVGNVSGVYINTLQVGANKGSGIRFAASRAGSPSGIFCTQLISDSNGVDGIRVDAGNSLEFAQCWASNRGGGVNWWIGPAAREIRIIGGKIYDCTGAALVIGATYVTVLGLVVEAASHGVPHGHDGIVIANTARYITLLGCRIFNGSESVHSGIKVETGASHYQIATSDFDVGGSASVLDENSVRK